LTFDVGTDCDRRQVSSLNSLALVLCFVTSVVWRAFPSVRSAISLIACSAIGSPLLAMARDYPPEPRSINRSRRDGKHHIDQRIANRL
jgi:hypothetical protein